MRKLNKRMFKLFFPFWYASKIKLTEGQILENEALYGDDDLFIMGEDRFAWEYEQKTGTPIMRDLILSALSWTIIILFIACISVFIVRLI